MEAVSVLVTVAVSLSEAATLPFAPLMTGILRSI